MSLMPVSFFYHEPEILACRNILLNRLRLENQAISHPAIRKCTNHIFVVKVVRETEFDPTCFIEGFQLFG